MNGVIIISGPTATGKTDTAIELAIALKERKRQCEIINFDSLLFYRELNIGTAKPGQEQLKKIPHHMIDIESAKNPLTAADFSRLVEPIIEAFLHRGKTPILVGGSGFYLQAVMRGMYPAEKPCAEILKRSEKLYADFGIDPFLEELQKVDSVTMNKLSKNDHYRIRRAIEYFWSHKRPFSDAKVEFENSPVVERFPVFKHFYLDINKEVHWSIIINRTKKMMENGLIDEVKKLFSEEGFSGQERPLKSIGYRQVIDYLINQNCSLTELENKISVATRQLAKAQRTWFNRVAGKNPIDSGRGIELAVKDMLNCDWENE